eukprot:TRINITY_DN2670_c0_g1_i1.p1 TRINITY_DN2670_c0_g1~~TRINITY_DN2670_c0_g1_i1.p1  ORF type:complete len:245 (-),score=41.82 TRINITY_DN2670_c0_g1_i1:539-1273(-)
MGKVHMGMARAGKVKSQTPMVAPQPHKKRSQGRSRKRDQFDQLCQSSSRLNPKKQELMEEIAVLPRDNPNPKAEPLLKERSSDPTAIEFHNSIPYFIYDSRASFSFTKQDLIPMLRREDELWKSSEVQEMFTTRQSNCFTPGEVFDMVTIERSIQCRVLEDFGHHPTTDDSLKAYRLSCGDWIHDPEVKDCVVWMKYDKMRFTSLSIGDELPNVMLRDLDGNQIPLTKIIPTTKPVILIGGSYT